MFTSLEVPRIQSWKLSNEPMPNELETPAHREWSATIDRVCRLMDTGRYAQVIINGVSATRTDTGYDVDAGISPA